jgi:CheY-like chemotaxis protein
MADKRIVCIDDDPFYADLFNNIFSTRGFQVWIAKEPGTGLDLIRKHKPDVVTLDVMMPEQESFFDGYGLLKQMREDPNLRQTPVIMVSALGDREDIQHGLDAGATAYLPKHEMTPDNLVELVNRKIEEAKAA